jgi:hypothetical protein
MNSRPDVGSVDRRGTLCPGYGVARRERGFLHLIPRRIARGVVGAELQLADPLGCFKVGLLSLTCRRSDKG